MLLEDRVGNCDLLLEPIPRGVFHQRRATGRHWRQLGVRQEDRTGLIGHLGRGKLVHVGRRNGRSDDDDPRRSRGSRFHAALRRLGGNRLIQLLRRDCCFDARAAALVAAIFNHVLVRRDLLGDFVFDEMIHHSRAARAFGFPADSLVAFVDTAQAIEPRVFVFAVVAAAALALYWTRRCAAWIRLAHFAALLAVAGNCNFLFTAAIAGDFHVFHFANDARYFVAVRFAATVVAFAIATFVGECKCGHGEQRKENGNDSAHELGMKRHGFGPRERLAMRKTAAGGSCSQVAGKVRGPGTTGAPVTNLFDRVFRKNPETRREAIGPAKKTGFAQLRRLD
jgi:hypothetical protein